MWADSGKYRVVGAIFAKARQRSGMTQKELALHVRKPLSFISNLERGQRRIDVIEFITLANAVKADPRRLFAQVTASLAVRKR